MPTCKHMKRQCAHPSPYPVMSLQTCLGYKNTPVRPAKDKAGNGKSGLQKLISTAMLDCQIIFNPRMPEVKIHLQTPMGGYHPPGVLPSRPNFLNIFLMGMFSGSVKSTVKKKKIYLYCMTLKFNVKHLFA